MENMEGLKPEFWNDRKVCVTGATGVVGSWLVKDLLKLGAQVVALVRDTNFQSELFLSGDIHRVKVVNGMLEDFSCVERLISKYEIDTVFHLAGQAIVSTAYRSPLATYESNIRGTYNLLEACRIHRSLVKGVVVASSDKAYGTHAQLPYTEDMPLIGRFPYEVSKSCIDLIAQSYFHSYQLPVAVIRCGNIYGGGDLNWSRIVPGTIRSFWKKESPVIRSDGKYVRDYIYVQDAARAYTLLGQGIQTQRLAGEVFNVSAEAPLTVLQLVEEIQKLMTCGHIKIKILNSAQGEIPSQYLSSSKIRSALKWQPQFDLQSGLQKTIQWYHEFLARK